MKKSMIISGVLFLLLFSGYIAADAQNTNSNAGRTVSTYYMDQKIPVEQQACLIGKKNITFSPMLLENKNSRLIWYEITVIPPGEHTYYVHYDSGHGRINNMPITARFEAGKYYTFDSNTTIIDSGPSKKERISVSIIEVTDNATIEDAKKVLTGTKDYSTPSPQPRPTATVEKTNDYKPQPNTNDSQKQKNEIAYSNKVMTGGIDTASIVNACHTYIRSGDAARIPELKDLLQRFGDISLAEDYLNCGNTALYDAGRDWGDQHGFNLGQGDGSHRVQWGAGGK